jgi:endonuclease-8
MVGRLSLPHETPRHSVPRQGTRRIPLSGRESASVFGVMPEGDTLHRIARALEPMAGERLRVEVSHPRARLLGLERLDGRRLEGVEARGKHLLLRFEGGLVLRSHLGMSGRWRVHARGAPLSGRPWLVLHGERLQAAQWNGPTLELRRSDPVPELGPDILAEPLDVDGILARLRGAPRQLALGEALLDQRLVAGIGNVWRAEGLWRARLSPWLPLAGVGEEELRAAIVETASAMRRSLAGRPPRAVYRRAGRPCPRCGAAIRSRAQGDAARVAYWCPGCQPER